MSIRLRAILTVILTNLFIILFSVSAGIIFVRENIRRSQETDLMVVSDIADHFISSEIENVKLKASIIAHHLEDVTETEWPVILAEQEILNPEFIGMAVIDIHGELIASMGELPASSELVNDIYMDRISLSSTIPSSVGMVFYLTVPLPDRDRILVLTLPGMYFSQRLSTFVI